MPVTPNPARSTELAYAEITSHVTGIGAAFTDVTGLTITFTVGARPVLIEAVLPLIGQVTLAGVPQFFIVNALGNDISRSTVPSLAAGAFDTPAPIRVRLPANTGLYTAKVSANTSAGTVSVFSTGTTYKAYIQATEL